MNIKKINGLTLSLLILTACSSHKVKPEDKVAKENKVTTEDKVATENKVKNNISTPIHAIGYFQPQPHISHLTIEKPYEGEESLAQSSSTYTPQRTSRLDEFYKNRENSRYTNIDKESTNIEVSDEVNDRVELTGDFQGNYKLIDFINRMSNQEGFDRSYLIELFSQANNTKYTETITPRRRNNTNTGISTGKWDRYRNMFIYERNIQRGITFWEEHKNTLNQAYQVYGVLPEYIVGIIGIETAYGVNFGKKRVIDVLTTKSMTGDRREEFYTKQLEKFLIMTRKANLQPAELMGSNAGAMGYGQFIPSSYLEFAVDFNNDGTTDLWNAQDAIGSIANYFSRNGWNRSLKTVAVRAKYPGSRFHRLKTGYKTKYSPYTLRKKYKITPRNKLHFNGRVSLIKLPKASYDELWMGTHNFRVLTTYNHSDLYGMAVHQLAKAVKRRRYN